MKSLIFLLIALSILLISCDKSEPADELLPTEYIGNILIDGEDDIPFLQDFFDAGYNSVRGDVIIEFLAYEADLSLLSNIIEINGSLHISIENLRSFHFLNNLKWVSELFISPFTSIDESDFPNLERVEERLLLRGTETNCEKKIVFPKLHTAGIIDLVDFNSRGFSFPSLIHVYNIKLSFVNRKCDEDLFPLIEHLNELLILDCDSIFDYQIFKNLNSVNRIHVVGDYGEGESLSLFKNLESVKNMSIFRCYRLKSLDGLNYLKGSIETLSIYENTALESLNGLGDELIIKDLKIELNGSLKSLKGCESVVSITNELRIKDNINLTDYCSLNTTMLPDSLEYIVKRNGFNPTIDMLQNGQCKLE